MLPLFANGFKQESEEGEAAGAGPGRAAPRKAPAVPLAQAPRVLIAPELEAWAERRRREGNWSRGSSLLSARPGKRVLQEFGS